MISASLAQIGEFSFILADLGVALGLLPEEGRDLILAGAIISILLNPLLFAALDLYAARRREGARRGGAADAREEEVPMREPIRPTSLRDHVVLIGHGRVGSFISSVLGEQNVPLFVIEDDEDGVAALKADGIEALAGNAADPAVIAAANLAEARCLLVAIPDAFEGGQVVQQAHAINPKPADHRARAFGGGDRPSQAPRRDAWWSWASMRSPRPCSTTSRRSPCWWRSRAAKPRPCSHSPCRWKKPPRPAKAVPADHHAALHAAHYDHRRRADARLGVRGGGAQGQAAAAGRLSAGRHRSSARSRRAMSPTRISPASLPRSASSC